MGDWDFINEHMGGHDSDGLPNFMRRPNFGDELNTPNHELHTILTWNALQRVVKKGEKGKGRGRYKLFSLEQTTPFKLFYISKKNGKFRRIFSVINKQKNQLRGLIPDLEKILLKHDSHQVNYAFTRNRNCVENAMQHIGYKYTVSMDLENFFESVNIDHVSKYLNKDITDQCFISGAPQQGLPTSPLIANLAFLDCDQAILNSLKKSSILSVYTRYADDLVVSLNDKKDIGKVIFLISKIVNNYGFKINKKKTRIQNINNGRIIITGVAIDTRGVYPTRKTIKKIRAAQHQNNGSALLGLTEWSKCKLPKKNNQPKKYSKYLGYPDIDHVTNNPNIDDIPF